MLPMPSLLTSPHRLLDKATLTWGLRRLLAGRGVEMRDLASKSWEIEPAEVQNGPPTLQLEGAVERIRTLSPWRNWDQERRLMAGGPSPHGATHMHLIENVSLSGAYLYCGAAKLQVGFESGARRSSTQGASRRPERLSEAHLVSNWASSHYFGMFMRTGLPLELLPEEGAPKVGSETKPYEQAEGYRALFALPAPPCPASAHIERLMLYEDVHQNASKERRYREIRARLRRALPASQEAPQGVYLKRGGTGEARPILNEAELETVLAARGFEIVEPARLEPREIAARLLDAPVIVSVEGSHLGHAIYTLAEGGALVTLQPPDRFALAFKEFTDRLGLRFGFCVGHAASEGPEATGAFRIDPGDLLRTLDLVAQDAAAREARL